MRSDTSKWEYLVLVLDTIQKSGVDTPRFANGREIPNWDRQNLPLHMVMDQYGNEGWELVTVYPGFKSLIFKRMK